MDHRISGRCGTVPYCQVCFIIYKKTSQDTIFSFYHYLRASGAQFQQKSEEPAPRSNNPDAVDSQKEQDDIALAIQMSLKEEEKKEKQSKVRFTTEVCYVGNSTRILITRILMRIINHMFPSKFWLHFVENFQVEIFVFKKCLGKIKPNILAFQIFRSLARFSNAGDYIGYRF